MADFKDWALQYVLSDDETAQHDIAKRAAAAIQSSGANSTTTGMWAASIDPWMTTEESSGPEGANAIAKAKALTFLADTLRELDNNTLRATQVDFLVKFFNSLFGLQHKAGVLPAILALKKLFLSKHFSPSMAVRTIDGVRLLKDDFRFQTATTRFETYTLVRDLMARQSMRDELASEYGNAYEPMVDLIQQCRNERDPKNLIELFGTLKTLLQDFDLPSHPPTAKKELFETFSPYFPISLRESSADIGVTVPELKQALRACFSSNGILADLSFPFLIQKLDQGGLNVGVKLDILETIQACISNYERGEASVVPFVEKIWGSLKYEVRNGEVEECISKTLEVLTCMGRAVFATGDSLAVEKMVTLICSDCIPDLSNPIYTEGAGRLLVSILSSSELAATLITPKLLSAVQADIHGPKSPTHQKDLAVALNRFLEARVGLLQAAVGDGGLRTLSDAIDISTLFHSVYSPLWRKAMVESPDKEQVAMAKELIRGFALLVQQPLLGGDKNAAPGDEQLLGGDQPALRTEICQQLSYRIVNALILSSKMNASAEAELDREAVLALQKCATAFPACFEQMMTQTQATLVQYQWEHPVPADRLETLKLLLSRLTYIGCTELPHAGRLSLSTFSSSSFTSPSASSHAWPLAHFATLTATLLQLLHRILDGKKEFAAAEVLVLTLSRTVLVFQEACANEFAPFEASAPQFSETWWTEIAAKFPHIRLAQPLSEKSLLESSEKYPGFPVIDQDSLGNLGALNPSATELPSSSPPSSSDPASSSTTLPSQWSPEVVRQSWQLNLHILVQLYRRAIRATDETEHGIALSSDFEIQPDVPARQQDEIRARQDSYLDRLGGLATIVLRLLSETEQRALRLHEQSFLLWSTQQSELDLRLSERDQGRTNTLSAGILKALWPGTLLQLSAPEGIANSFLSDLLTLTNLPARTHDVRDAIARILANKYTTTAGNKAAGDAQKATWTHILEYLETALSNENDPLHPSADEWVRALAVIAGAALRMDRTVAKLAPRVMATAAASARRARNVALLAVPRPYLTAPYHAVTRPLARAWTYTHFIKPMLAPAHPQNQQGEDKNGDDDSSISSNNTTGNHALAVLHTLQHIPYQVYQDDSAAVSRVALAALDRGSTDKDNDKSNNTADGAWSWADTGAALAVLLAILGGDPGALREHAKALINGAVRVYNRSRGTGSADAARCRRDAVVLLARIPGAGGFEEKQLARLAPALARTLGGMSGDAVREIRQAALAAREAWGKVGVAV